MADEKKPKIDLKARLGKTNLGAQTAVPAPAPGGVPVPPPSSVTPPPPSARPAPPPGIPVGPPPAFGSRPAPALDPSNPLAAAVSPAYRAPAQPAAPPPQAQRIEVDDSVVQEARKGALRQGILVGSVVALVLGAVGFFGGQASQQSADRKKSVEHAQQLAGDVDKAKVTLEEMGKKLEEGRNALVRERKFPEGLARDLGGLNVDFDGTKLAGVRFSGFSLEASNGLLDFVSQVTSLNDRRSAIVGLLGKLQKPITEQLAGPQAKIQHIVLIDRDPSKNAFALLAPLQKPIEINPANVSIPSEWTAVNPLNKQVVTAPPFKTGDPSKTGIYVLPKSFDSACPSETSGAIAQLGSQLSKMISDIKGEKAAAGGDAVVDDKPGLVDRASRLSEALKKVQ